MPWAGPDEHLAFPSLGDQVVDWMEAYLVHGPGDVIGQPIELDDEMYEFIVQCYRLDPDTGRRTVRRAFLSRAKGRSKSEVAGLLVCAEALGPVRFAGWDSSGQPVGRPVTSPYVRCLATEEGQSGNTFDNVSVMLSHLSDKHGDTFPGIDIGRSAQSSTRILLHHHHGEIVPSTASGSAKDGGKETFAVFDETHLYVLPELHRMHDVVRRNLRKRLASDPWALETSTMYRPGEDSVAEQTHNYAKLIAEGKARETGLLFSHKEAPPDTDLADRESLLHGLRVAYGPAAAWMDLDGIIAEIWDPQNDPSDSRRYWLNQVVASSDSWIAPDAWNRCADPKVVADGEQITLGFDGSLREDATALVGCRLSDGHLFVLGSWEKPDGLLGKDWMVDRDEVDVLVQRAYDRFDVVGHYCDPPHYRDYVSKWTAAYAERLQIKAAPAAPLEWWTSRLGHMVLALQRFHDAVANGDLSHDGPGVLTRHVLNARRRTSRSGLVISKESPQSQKKIDAAMAAVLAYEARADAVAAGVANRKQRERSKRLVRF